MEKTQKLCDLLQQGKTYQEIGNEYGVTRQTVANWVKQLGLKPLVKPRSGQIILGDAISQLADGESTNSVAEHFNVSLTALDVALSKHNLRPVIQELKRKRALEEYFQSQIK